MQQHTKAALAAVFAVTVYAVGGAATTATADGYREPRARVGMCGYHKSARYLVSLAGTDRLWPEVERRYTRAVHTADASIGSGSPRFIWATQAKVACAKALGYLKYPLRREATRESLQKCECFSSRMQAFGR